MSFSEEERKEVFEFFETLLKSYNAPTYYENIRGHVSKATPTVKKYVLHKCKGDSLLDFFKKRKNYFQVEEGHVSLIREKKRNPKLEDSLPICKYRQKSRTESETSSKSYASSIETQSTASSIGTPTMEIIKSREEKQKWEEYTLKYFVALLSRKGLVHLPSINQADFPKKVARYMSDNFNGNFSHFVWCFPNIFHIDDSNYLKLTQNNIIKDSIKPSNICNGKSGKDVVQTHPELHKAVDYIQSVEFFIEILKKSQSPHFSSNIGSYLSQAPTNIKQYIKLYYKNFTEFFHSIPLFNVRDDQTVNLIENHCKLLNSAKKFVADIKSGSHFPFELSIIEFVKILLKTGHLPSFKTESSNKVVQAQQEIESVHLENECQDSTEISSVLNFDSEDESGLNVLLKKNPSDLQSSMNTNDSVNDIPSHDDKVCWKYPIFICELLALEMAENELYSSFELEFDCLQYFIQALIDRGNESTLNSLKGSLSRASKEIRSYMNVHYKDVNFNRFFVAHKEEFKVQLGLVTLCNGVLPGTSLRDTGDSTAKINVSDLFDTWLFRFYSSELLALLSEICSFLLKKENLKLGRILEVISKYPDCFSLIKRMVGNSSEEQTKKFLDVFEIFEAQPTDRIRLKMRNQTSPVPMLLLKKLKEYENYVLDIKKGKTPIISEFHSSLKKSDKNINPFSESQISKLVFDIENVLMKNPLKYHELIKFIPTLLSDQLFHTEFYVRDFVKYILEGNFVVKNGFVCSENNLKTKDCISIAGAVNVSAVSLNTTSFTDKKKFDELDCTLNRFEEHTCATSECSEVEKLHANSRPMKVLDGYKNPTSSLHRDECYHNTVEKKIKFDDLQTNTTCSINHSKPESGMQFDTNVDAEQPEHFDQVELTRKEPVNDSIFSCEENFISNDISNNQSDSKSKNTESTSEKQNQDYEQLLDSNSTYPIQPLIGKIILLTLDSCIAQIEIKSCKINIYILKSVFSCEKIDCGSECFHSLNLGDEVSCFVPISEVTKKVWIACMASKEDTAQLVDIKSINNIIENYTKAETERESNALPHKRNGSLSFLTCKQSSNFSLQNVTKEESCQTEADSAVSKSCQTETSGDIQSCVVFSHSSTQTSSDLMFTKNISVQTYVDVKFKESQTEVEKGNATCQTDITGSVKEIPETCEVPSQTDIIGDVKIVPSHTDAFSQTIVTGKIFSSQHLQL